MNWTEQADSMLKTWTEAQKTVWEGWYDIARTGPGEHVMPSMANPMGWMKQGMEAWTKGAGSTSQGVAGQIFGSQANMMGSLQLLTNMWKMFGPQIESGGDWQGAVQNYMQKWSEQMLGTPQRMSAMTGDTGALFKSFLGEWGPLLKPWLGAASEAAMSGHFGGMMLGGSDGLSKLLNIGQDLEPAFEGFAEIPSIGSSREQNAKIMRAFDAFVDFRKVNVKYQVTLAKIMGQAVEHMMEQLAKLAKEGKEIKSVRELMKVWVRTADQTFTDVYATEEYHALQHELSAAGMTYKIKQQEVLDMIFKTLNLPSRAELDDAYLTLYELKKEVKALKKELKTAKPEARTAAKSAPKRKAAAGKAK